MSSQETPYQRLRRKIEALIRHSRGTDNEKEARIFVQKAAELMEKCAQLVIRPAKMGLLALHVLMQALKPLVWRFMT